MKYAPIPILIIIAAFIHSCANQGAPTGGPMDTIPPVLIESYPPNKTTNFDGQEFKLYFDERINTDKIKQNLIITPLIENPYKFKYRKNFLILKFEEPFDSLTTYTLNFANGVTDVTEKTPAVNLKLAFSTGPNLDSIYVSGRVFDLYTNKTVKDAIVTLYHVRDTLDLLTGKPRYFAKTDEKGNFLIENIKDGFYKIYAFVDANNNLINQPEEEEHGFLKDSIDLTSSKSEITIRTQLLDINPLSFKRGKYTGIYYDIEYSKYLDKYQLTVFNNPLRLPVPANNLIDNNTTIRMYYDSTYRYELDSIGLLIRAYDSLANQTEDTVFVKFRSSKRKPAAFLSTMLPKNRTKIEDKLHAKLTFDKPLSEINLDSARIMYDTLYTQLLPDSIYNWNPNFTELKFDLALDPKWFVNKVDSLMQHYSDTSNKDSIYIAQGQYLNRVDTSSFDIIIPKGAFISVQNDTAGTFIRKYSFKKAADFGTVEGEVITNHPSYTVQLVTPEYNVIQQLRNPKKYKFKNIPQGKYTFRVLIDEDNNGTWDYGNLYLNKEPEAIFFYEESFDLRANWQLENINITF